MAPPVALGYPIRVLGFEKGHGDMDQPLADTAAKDTPKPAAKKPRGWLSKVFGRHAPWWVKVIRSAVLLVGTLATIDGVVLPNMPGRPLTPDEITMLREVYKDSVPYDKLRVHNSPLADAFLHATNATATTRGNVIFIETTPEKDNYASPKSDYYMQYTLVHEVGHVWQDHNGLMPNVVSMAILNFSRLLPGADAHTDYRYDVTRGKDLLDYNIEQQASIITEFHFASKQGMEPIFNNGGTLTPQQMDGYRATLKNFIANPSYPKNR